jgi:hypothetical protein
VCPSAREFQKSTSASSTGTLCSSGASRKWTSALAAPPSSSTKVSQPQRIAIGSPAADQSE